MNRPILALALCAATALFVAGCNMADGPPQPNLSQKASPALGSSSAPAVAVPVMPGPSVPKGAEAPAPNVGQAGDHSNPEFKAGGKADPHR